MYAYKFVNHKLLHKRIQIFFRLQREITEIGILMSYEFFKLSSGNLSPY